MVALRISFAGYRGSTLPGTSISARRRCGNARGRTSANTKPGRIITGCWIGPSSPPHPPPPPRGGPDCPSVDARFDSAVGSDGARALLLWQLCHGRSSCCPGLLGSTHSLPVTRAAQSLLVLALMSAHGFQVKKELSAPSVTCLVTGTQWIGAMPAIETWAAGSPGPGEIAAGCVDDNSAQLPGC